jgi:hypothetical protein
MKENIWIPVCVWIKKKREREGVLRRCFLILPYENKKNVISDNNHINNARNHSLMKKHDFCTCSTDNNK